MEEVALCGLTFELSRHQRCDARARVAKMYRVPPAGPAWHAVGARLERGVRLHRLASRGGVTLQRHHSDPCPAREQEQSRYSASAVRTASLGLMFGVLRSWLARRAVHSVFGDPFT